MTSVERLTGQILTGRSEFQLILLPRELVRVNVTWPKCEDHEVLKGVVRPLELHLD